MKLLLPLLMLPLISCAAAPGPLGEQTLDITDFDFSTPFTTLLPDSYKSKTWGDSWYEVPQTAFYDTNLMVRDSVRSWDTDELLWIAYRQQGFNSADEYLSFEEHTFNAANLITGLDGRIGVIAGKAGWDTEEACKALIERITKRHGAPTHTTKEFCNESYDLFTWTLDDRTIKYAVVGTDESNVLKLELEHDAEGRLSDIREGKREQRIQSYIFVFDKGWAEKFAEAGQSSGDFVYGR